MINSLNLRATKSNTTRLLLENKWVRVLELGKNSNQVLSVRNHPNANIFNVYNDSKCRLSFPDGSGTVFEVKAQQTLCIEQNSKKLQHSGNTQEPNLVIEMNNQVH